MIDEVTLEELRSRAWFEKMDEAFCAALLNAIEAGQENRTNWRLYRTWHAAADLLSRSNV